MTPKIKILVVSILLTAQLIPVASASAKNFGFQVNKTMTFGAFTTAPSTHRAVTCDQSGPTGCDLDEFIYLCVEGGGGASKEPGGGVTCDVRPN